jgi:hypothetical protein
MPAAEARISTDAGTGPALQRTQELVSGNLARFGRRDQLSVAWRRLDPPA